MKRYEESQLRPHFLESHGDSGIYTPEFFRISNPEASRSLKELMESRPSIKVTDTIHSQLCELVKAQNPAKRFTLEQLREQVVTHLNGTPEWAYGVWVYFPWNDRLVHILDEPEFVLMRTNRNRNKITTAEQEVLATKKIGVIGLSVGQSVSLTLAMERGFGELRIADFDDLEITNLNRLRAGIHHLGVRKTVIVAREIAEIDPFLRVIPFHEGIHEHNLELFLTGGGPLDVLIDECDSVDIKIACRLAAKKHHIPVLMEASDRGTIDVERFDLEPDREVLHGFVKHLDLSRLKDLKTSEEKLPYMLPIAGVETLSSRMKASALEIGQTINTWPQLASAVMLGGGITADVCRRLLLNQFKSSGRYFIDVESLIGDAPLPGWQSSDGTELTIEYMQQSVSALHPQFTGAIEVDASAMHHIIRAAQLAPSPGNNQPWKWFEQNSILWLFHDPKRAHSFGNIANMASYMAMGAALENVSLAAAEKNLEAVFQLFPKGIASNLVAQVHFTSLAHPATDGLAGFIESRCTNRLKGNGTAVASEPLSAAAIAAAAISGATLHCLSNPGEILAMAEIIAQADRLRVFIPEGHYDLFEREMRWSNPEAKHAGDGIDITSFGLSLSASFGMRMARDPQVMQLLHAWNGGQGLAKISKDAVLSFGTVGLITMPDFNSTSCILAGRAAERVWLSLTAHGVAMQPMLSPLLHFARLQVDPSSMPQDIQSQFRDLQMRFNQLWAIPECTQVPLFLFRMGYAPAPPVPAYRLPLHQIFFTDREDFWLHERG